MCCVKSKISRTFSSLYWEEMVDKSEQNAPDKGVVPLWLTESETALRLSMSTKWLQKARLSGTGPRFAKFGSAVRYSVAGLEAYERACLRASTSDCGSR